MGVENRPYIGTFRLNQRKVVQHTPDCFVFINGDMSVPGCPRCSGRINFQQYITSVSVEAGTDAGSHSSTISMSFPRTATDSFVRDAEFIFRPGLEIFVYMRGYFPTKGLYGSLAGETFVKKDGKISSQSRLRQLGLKDTGIENVIAHPYYHVFHGVTTQVDHSYSGGFNTATLNCTGMLHFWQYHNMSTNASVFGARPTNSQLKMSLIGHNFTGMTPYEILYTLFHDTAGAASEVGFALSSKTNQTAKSTVAGKSLYSLTLEYWRRRFNTRMMNLRLHGVSGALFNSAQAAFLGRLSTSKTTRILRGRFAAKDQQSKTMNFLSTAKTLGFFSPRLKDALTYAEKASNTKKPNEINIGMMQAFATDISAFGNVNLWESTYQSKLDIAKQVAELTGFEFYQDVDGDLVFKPPLYNLDTRTSRVYRLEDIDIISFNHSEKEPEVTYMTVKGSHFKNLRGLGLDNEWGVRGQYIDYRAVAQFGWRPGSFETTYFTDPRAMFFAAINRMDIMNAGIRSASATIPIRPELRPGYPLYVVHKDCFYYLRSLSHSFQFGGQCTTSLQMIGKRSKFYAPGDPDKIGIDAINLRNMILPERPLLVKGDGGVPRYSGFPNVVMALDPNQINPLYFVIGSDIENIGDPQTLGNLITQAASKEFGLISERIDENGKKYYFIRSTGDKFFLETTQGKNASSGVVDIIGAARSYARLQTGQAKTIQTQRKKISLVNRDILRKESRRRKLQQSKTPNESAIAKIEVAVQKLEAKRDKLVKDYSKQQTEFEKSLRQDPGVSLLKTLIDQVGNEFLKNNSNYKDLNSSANFLDLLSDKKATLTNGQVPGTYRYYSASHPNPEHQGMTKMTFSDEQGKVMTQQPSRVRIPTKVSGGGYRKAPVAQSYGEVRPEAELDPNYKAERGIQVLTNDPNNPRQVYTTDQIRTIMFASHDVKKTVYMTDYRPGKPFDSLDPNLKPLIKAYFSKIPLKGSETLANSYRSAWNAISVWKGKTGLNVLGSKTGPIYAFDRVTAIPVRGKTLTTRNTIDQNKTALQKYQSTAALQDLFADMLSTTWWSQANTLLKNYYTDNIEVAVKAATNKKASATQRRVAVKTAEKFDTGVLGVIYQKLNAVLGKIKGRVQKSLQKLLRPVVKTVSLETPIFPVSDAGGYRVVGTYRYGRDIDIEPNGVMDILYRQDPLQFVDRKTREDYVNAKLGKSITVKIQKSNGTFVEQKLSGQEAVTASEKRLVDGLKNNPAALDVLDRVIKTSGKTVSDAGQLDTALMNWVADNRDGIAKLPLINAAFNLSDLQTHISKNICACKTAEAEVFINAMNQEQFMVISKNEGSDKVSQWVKTQAESLKDDWEKHRMAIQGSVTNSRNSNLANTFKEAILKFTQNGETLSQLEASLNQDKQVANAIIQLQNTASPLVNPSGENT